MNWLDFIYDGNKVIKIFSEYNKNVLHTEIKFEECITKSNRLIQKVFREDSNFFLWKTKIPQM